jgi:hypothetical protein
VTTAEGVSEITEYYENETLYGSSTAPSFYYEDSTKTVTFGYGINLTAITSPTLQTAVGNVLATIGVTNINWAAINAGS